jgi:hypothetical protein
VNSKLLAIFNLCLAASVAVVLRTPFATIIVGLSVVVLLIGFHWRKELLTVLAGWLLYLPLAAVLARALPPSWSYLLSGLLVMVVSESLAFQREASATLESSAGVDSEALLLTSNLSRTHTRKMAAYVALTATVMVVSAAASTLTAYASELVAATILLMLAVTVYANR